MNHRNTRIYGRALELVAIAKRVEDKLPRGYGHLADELRRASSSVVLNFAEGCGKRTPRERRRFFTMAKASVHEVAAVFDVAVTSGDLPRALHGAGTDASDHVAAMLHRFR